MALTEKSPLDLRHLSCPLPFVHLHRAMRKLSPQENLETIVATGTTSDDMIGWAEKMGYCAVLLEKNTQESHFILKQKS
ncbi:sulfurtransferase TusA family protein [Acetobacteraceae bacterium]|nr:sulfurtransferase TusA family protein [Acetobacteraceae bacterium]